MPKKTTKAVVKKVVKKKAPKKNKVAVLPNPDRKLAWGGSMPKPQSQGDAEIQVFVNQIAPIYGVPSMGVNVMGNQPYLNKDGRLYLLHELRKDKASIQDIKTEYLNLSMSATEPSICKVTLVFKDGHTVEGIGEASATSVKLSAVKATLNMMAETRATNRAIWKEIAGDVWNRVAENLKASDLSEEEKAKVHEAGRMSAEEVNTSTEMSFEEMESKVRTYAEKLETATALMGFLENINNSELYREEFKAEMSKYISGRVDEIENRPQ